jgi:hypothetical protein
MRRRERSHEYRNLQEPPGTSRHIERLCFDGSVGEHGGEIPEITERNRKDSNLVVY